MDLCISTSNEDVESCRSGREKTWAGKRPRSTRGARVYFSQFAQKHLLNECNEMQLQCLPFPTLPAVLLWSCTKSLLAHLSYHSNNKAFLIIIHVLYYMQCLWMPGSLGRTALNWTRLQNKLNFAARSQIMLHTLQEGWVSSEDYCSKWRLNKDIRMLGWGVVAVLMTAMKLAS